MASQEMMEACLDSKEPNPEEMQSRVEHREVPKEHNAMKPGRALKKRHWGWNLAAEHRQKLEEWTQGYCGSWKKLTASCKRMTHQSGVAWHKGNIVGKNRTRDMWNEEPRKDKKKLERPGMQNWNKGPRQKTAATS